MIAPDGLGQLLQRLLALVIGEGPLGRRQLCRQLHRAALHPEEVGQLGAGIVEAGRPVEVGGAAVQELAHHAFEAAAGQEDLEGWRDRWLARIALIFNLNALRLKHYDPSTERQTAMFEALQEALGVAVEALFNKAQTECDAVPEDAREARPLQSLIRHREGLSVFVDHPRVPMDNNLAERIFRDPVIGRQLSFGSDSEEGAAFTAIMYSVIGTLAMNGITVRRWLHEWLEACARNAGKPPDDLDPWLPWTMSPERRRDLMEPG